MSEPTSPHDPHQHKSAAGTDSSRRAFLSAGAAGAVLLASGGRAAAEEPGRAIPGQVVKATEGGQFREALRKLASDTAYRNAAGATPKKLTDDFKLSMQDYRNLRDAAVLSGVDVKEIDKLLTAAETGPVIADGVHTSPSCCCCCCCGEAGAFLDRWFA